MRLTANKALEEAGGDFELAKTMIEADYARFKALPDCEQYKEVLEGLYFDMEAHHDRGAMAHPLDVLNPVADVLGRGMPVMAPDDDRYIR